MPELPEVQTIVNDLNKKIIGRRIVNFWFDWPKMLHTKNSPVSDSFGNTKASPRIFTVAIKGKKILGIKRRAKNILIYLSDNLLLLIHLKMTGHLLVGRWRVKGFKVIPLAPKEIVNDPYNQYIHLIFYLDNGLMLGFSDLRKFGKAVLGMREQIENSPEIKKIGPEPLSPDFKFKEFAELIKAEKRKIKQVLMDQEIIAGIGNIYSDDILWLAKIHPSKPANKLSVKELKYIWNALREVLTKALKLRGASVSDYRDTAGKEGGYDKVRLVYQKENEPCRRCRAAIKRIKFGGRSAHFCPRCQKL